MKQKFMYGFLSFLLSIAIATACSKTDNTRSSSSDNSSNNYSDSTVNPDPIEVTACSAHIGISAVICLANAFNSQLDASQLAAVQLDYSVSDAERWSNLPQALSRNRVGLN